MNASFSSVRNKIRDGFRRYRFGMRHLAILLLVLVGFQIIVLLIGQRSLQGFYNTSKEWYQRDAAERIANLTATSFELLLESTGRRTRNEADRQQIIQEFNIIFSQQLLEENVQSVSILIPTPGGVLSLDDGEALYEFFYGEHPLDPGTSIPDQETSRWFAHVEDQLRTTEQTRTVIEGTGIFHVFVPFVPQGEYAGAVYMRSSPNLAFLANALSEGYDETAIAYVGLIILGLVAMFYISTRTLKERDEAQQRLFEEQKQHLSDEIHHQRELVFTKRIYHTHHKAEKVSGFVKEDLRSMTHENMAEVRDRIDKYVSFIGRVIYDMKWYDPPIQTIRGPLFKTDINKLLRFLTDHIFLRGGKIRQTVTIDLKLDETLPVLPVNEYVAWEVLEPLIQNSLDHASSGHCLVTVSTFVHRERDLGSVVIEDTGKGIAPHLLEKNEHGVRNIFLEDVSYQEETGKGHSGYGCHISHEIATQRLGWTIDVRNKPEGGARFELFFPLPRG